MNDIQMIDDWIKVRLTEKRYIHSLGVAQVAKELAVRFGADPEKAYLAGLIHDNAKCLKDEDLYKIIEDNKLSLTESELQSKKIIHSPVGAFLAKKELGIEDQDILSSVKYHTVGKIDMSLFEKIIYLADKIEPNRKNKEFIKEVRAILDETGNIDKAILLTYGKTIKSLVERKLFINIQTIEVWNNLLVSLGS